MASQSPEALRGNAGAHALPGIEVNTAPDDYFPIEQMQLMRFDGEAWRLFGDVITGEVH